MADFTGLNQAVTDLTNAVAAEVANLDKLWTDYQTLLSQPATDQAALDAASQAIEAQISTMQADLTAHTAP